MGENLPEDQISLPTISMKHTPHEQAPKIQNVSLQAAVKDPWTESLAEVASPDFSQSVSRPPIAGDKAKVGPCNNCGCSSASDE